MPQLLRDEDPTSGSTGQDRQVVLSYAWLHEAKPNVPDTAGWLWNVITRSQSFSYSPVRQLEITKDETTSTMATRGCRASRSFYSKVLYPLDGQVHVVS
jgi:hypothetical protein